MFHWGTGKGNRKEHATLLKSCVVVIVVGNSGRNVDQEDCVLAWCVLT